MIATWRVHSARSVGCFRIETVYGVRHDSPHLLAVESKSAEERRDQAYGTQEANPSVITMNAVVASHAVNDFLLSYLGLFEQSVAPEPLRFKHLDRQTIHETYNADAQCTGCGARRRFADGSRRCGRVANHQVRRVRPTPDPFRLCMALNEFLLRAGSNGSLECAWGFDASPRMLQNQRPG